MKVANAYKDVWGEDVENKPKKKKIEKSSNSIFSFVEKRLFFSLFLTAIGLFYIWNAHYAEKQARYAEGLRQELKELKSEYMTLNAELSVSRTQSQIANIVDSLGLKSLTEPPFKLEIEKE